MNTVTRSNVFAFAPQPDRTAALDRAIRSALAESVARVLAGAAEVGLNYDGDFGAWRDALLATRGAPPLLWACYHDLVQAIVRDEPDTISALASELLGRRPDHAASRGTVLTITEEDLGPVDAARYRAVIDSNPDQPLNLCPARASEVSRLRGLADEARRLLAVSAPALLDEIDTLGHQIVLATNASGAFGGAATVFLWGAVILNPSRVPDRVTMVEGLAHETAHALLFGMTLGADLTTNPPAERYASPLRPDPRPIEGIVHATYVLARMNYALTGLRTAPGLRDAERELIEAKIARNAASYEAGLETVLAHARFTPDGEAIFAACREAAASAP